MFIYYMLCAQNTRPTSYAFCLCLYIIYMVEKDELYRVVGFILPVVHWLRCLRHRGRGGSGGFFLISGLGKYDRETIGGGRIIHIPLAKFWQGPAFLLLHIHTTQHNQFISPSTLIKHVDAGFAQFINHNRADDNVRKKRDYI